MRRFIISSNNENVVFSKGNTMVMNVDDLPIIFGEDVLNVVNHQQYNQLLDHKYMYGLEIELSDYLTDYSQVLAMILEEIKDYIVVFDVSTKRYINHWEVEYFSANLLLPSKLFNIEIAQDNRCHYQTIGMSSLGLKEMEYYSDKQLNEEEYQLFRAIVSYELLNLQCKAYVNNTLISYQINDNQRTKTIQFILPEKIYDFYIRDCNLLNNIRYQLISYHWQQFLQLKQSYPHLGKFRINKAQVNDIHNFHLAHVEEFTIICEDINYNQDNLFYAYKYL